MVQCTPENGRDQTMPSQTPFAFASRFQLSTADFQLFRTNSFRLIQFRKNASVSPLVSHSFKTKDLKPFRFTHFQKKGGGWRAIFARADLLGPSVSCESRFHREVGERALSGSERGSRLTDYSGHGSSASSTSSASFISPTRQSPAHPEGRQVAR